MDCLISQQKLFAELNKCHPGRVAIEKSDARISFQNVCNIINSITPENQPHPTPNGVLWLSGAALNYALEMCMEKARFRALVIARKTIEVANIIKSKALAQHYVVTWQKKQEDNTDYEIVTFGNESFITFFSPAKIISCYTNLAVIDATIEVKNFDKITVVPAIF